MKPNIRFGFGNQKIEIDINKFSKENLYFCTTALFWYFLLVFFLHLKVHMAWRHLKTPCMKRNLEHIRAEKLTNLHVNL